MLLENTISENENLRNEILLLKKQNEDYLLRITKLNNRLKDTEGVLRKALDKITLKEKELIDLNTEFKERTEELQASEEELKQQNEEILVQQENLEHRTNELEKANQRLRLSEGILKKAYDKMKNNESQLKKANAELLEKTDLLVANEEALTVQYEEIRGQKKEIEKKNKNLTQSIQYALKIQEAMLPTSELLSQVFADHFILFKPKDIVSGDFYWFKRTNNLIYIAVADCTGHGVPGAFMSMLGISHLNEIFSKQELTAPNQILNELRERIKMSLNQKGQKGQTQDGMDIAFCVIDLANSSLEFSGAYNPLYLFRQNQATRKHELLETKADKMPIGVHPRKNSSFTSTRVHLQAGDRLYLFSDGYTSQFGGFRNEKFKTKRFQDLLFNIQNLPMQSQKQVLDDTIVSWRGDNVQIDDILVVGIKICDQTDKS